jgi:uncharacterized membrane protein
MYMIHRWTQRLTQSIWPVIGLAAVLRFVGLGRLSLWYDEAFTAWLARLPVSRMLVASTGDVHPPTWYAIEGIFIRVLGGSEWILRLPAAILGVVNVYLTFRVARAWGFRQRVAWLAALLVAVAPVAIYYSQEARSYQLLTLGGLVMALAAAKWRWWLFVGGGIVAVYSHNLGAFYVPAMAGAVLTREWQQDHAAGMAWHYWLRWRLPRSLVRVGSAGAIILLAWLPWLAVMFQQMGKVAGGFWIPPFMWGSWLQTWVFLAWGPFGYAGGTLAAVPVALLLAAVAVYSGVWSRHWGLLMWLLLPGLLVSIVSVLWRPIYLDRAFLPVLSVLAILLALALTKSQDVRLLALPALPLLVIWLVMLYRGPTKVAIRDYAAIIQQDWEPGDLVFHGNLASYILFEPYLPDVENTIWRQANDLRQSLTDETKEAMGMNQVTEADLADYQRLWLVWTETLWTSPAESQLVDGILTAWPSQEVVVIQDSPTITSRIYLVDLGSSTGH